MNKQFGKTLFGFKPGEVINEIERMDSEHQQKIEQLKMEIEKVKLELNNTHEKQAELQNRLKEYSDRERLVTDVMVNAQINAQKIEEQARERARMMLESSEEELKHKLQELDFLRLKVARFKEEFRDVLDNYRVSLEKIKEVPDDVTFTPTLVSKEKGTDSAKISS